MTKNTFNINALAIEHRESDPYKILELALKEFENIAISFSGAEDVVLIDMAVKINPAVKIFTLDTGRLHPETYQFLEKVRDHYNVQIEVSSPDHRQLEEFVQKKGLYSFYKDGHQECCGIRKIAPLRRKLEKLDAWVTGQRRDQSPQTRSEIFVIERDEIFSSSTHTLVKFNPLANCSSQTVWHYIRDNNVPYNLLHYKGFTSIGCEPCTRSVLPNQHEREGRWWWEEATAKECGLHWEAKN